MTTSAAKGTRLRTGGPSLPASATGSSLGGRVVRTEADNTGAQLGTAAALRDRAARASSDDSTPESREQRRLTRWVILAPVPVAIALGLYAVLTHPGGSEASASFRLALLGLTLAIAPLALVCIGALDRGARPSSVFAAFLAAALTVLSAVCYLRGGIHSPTLTWLLVITTGAMLAGGRRLGMGSIAAAATMIAGFYVLDWTRFALPDEVTRELSDLRWLPNMMAIAFLLYCQVALFEGNKQRALESLRGANTELSAARDLADAANRSKSALLANVSHEIRSPMTAILGFADMVHERSTFASENPQARSELDTVRRSGSHLLEIINDILDLSKIEAGRFDLAVSHFSPTQLVEDIVDLMRVRADASGIRLEVDVSPELPAEMTGDRKRIKQILINLVGNAIKFTREGTVWIRVAPTESAGNGSIRFEVRDEGIGMSPDQIDRLFRPFSQADSSTTRLYGGTGLGLAICKRLAELMRGTIHVESQLGRGSLFQVDLPASSDTDAGDAASPAAAPAWSGAESALPGASLDQHQRASLRARATSLCLDIHRRWEAIREFFIPDCLREDPAELARARFITTFCLLPLPLIPAWALVLPTLTHGSIGPKLSALIVLVTPLLIAVPFQLRRGASLRAPVHILLCYLWLMFGLLAAVTAGVGSPAVAWMLVPPIVAVATLGIREGAVWTALCCVQLGGFQLLDSLGIALPNVVPEANTALIGALNLTSVIVLTGAFGGLYQRTSAEALSSFRRTNRDLAEARDRADQANASKSEFIANISHELRTPMTAILGFTDVLLDRWPHTTAEAEHVQSLETVRRNGLHLLEIINDILDLSKIEAGRIELEREPMQPVELAREVFELMRIRAEEKQLALELELDAELPEWVYGDALRIRQVLMNLLGNAIKFTDAGRVELRLHRSERRRGDFLAFSIRDTGIGISPDQLELLFEPYRQADATVSARYGGTGLGLAICKRLSELMGGRIRVRSTVGSGSVFTLEFPCAPCAAPGDEARARESWSRVPPRGAGSASRRAPAPAARALGYSRPKPRPLERDAGQSIHLDAEILLVDDSADNQRLISWILEKLGARVTLASNGEAALAAVEHATRADRRFDLVLMDLQMPVLDGYATIEKLRATGHDLPIIALSAHAMAEARERALAAGADGYATKPIVKQELLPLMQELLGGEDKTSSRRASRSAVD